MGIGSLGGSPSQKGRLHKRRLKPAATFFILEHPFWLLHFAWRCGIKSMECGSIIRTLPVEKKALAGEGVLRHWAVAPNMRLHANGFASLRSARRR